eukprot:scaffold7846_cov417-Prasinococcus_capsulatus_cf.AAC.6
MESEWRHKRHQSMALHSEAKQARMAPNAEERAGRFACCCAPVVWSVLLSVMLRAGWLSRHTFTWASPLVRQGYRRQLHLADIWQVWMGSSAKRMKTVSCGQIPTEEKAERLTEQAMHNMKETARERLHKEQAAPREHPAKEHKRSSVYAHAMYKMAYRPMLWVGPAPNATCFRVAGHERSIEDDTVIGVYLCIILGFLIVTGYAPELSRVRCRSTRAMHDVT